MPKQRTTVTVPKLVNGRGTLPIRRSFKGVGEIRVASGTTDPVTYQRILSTLQDLANVGNLETLKAVKNRAVTPMEVYDAVRQRGVGTVVTAVGTAIQPAVEEFLRTHTVKENTRRGYESHLSGFFKTLKASDTVRDLPTLLEKYRKVAARRGIARSFNQVRAALMAFARSEFKKKSALYQDLREIDTLPVTKKLKNDAVDYVVWADYLDGMSEVHQEALWTMSYTGMRVGEYLEQNGATWQDSTDRVAIIKSSPGHGNKGGSRITLRPFPPARAQRGVLALRRAMNKRNEETSLRLTPNTCRKNFAFWCGEAGISPVRISLYMGHRAVSMTDQYAKHEVDNYLKTDAERLRAYAAACLYPETRDQQKTPSKYGALSKLLGVDIISLDPTT